MVCCWMTGLSVSAPDKNIQRGASGKQVGLRDRLRGYRLHHRATLRITLEKILREPLQSLMTIAVIAIALALPSALYIAVDNLQTLGGSFDTSTQISVFLSRDASEAVALDLQKKIRAMNGIDDVQYLSKEKALIEFAEFSGFGATLRHLDKNPLPSVLLVKPDENGLNGAQKAQLLIEKIAGIPSVDDVQLDLRWLQRLEAILALSQKVVLALALALGLGVLLVISNTIRLAIESRRDEIVVIKLVGGTNGYVRRPFLYTGLIYGLSGALVAWLMVQLCLYWLGVSTNQLAELYSSSFRLEGLGFDGFCALLLIGGGLGLAGAWGAVGKHLRNIEPR